MSTPVQQVPLDAQSPPADVMAKARTVALIVHGVGDHSQTDILDGLDYGLQQALPPKSFEATRLKLSKVLLPSGSFGNADVTQIQTSGAEHFVIPVIWSHEHLRAEPEIKYHSLLQGSSIQRLTFLVMRVARPLVALCLNSFRCIPKATGAWKLALAATSLLILALEIVATLGLWFLLISLPYLLPPHTGGRRTWPYIIAVAIIPILVITLFRKLVPLLDLVGDVVFYVGRPKQRSEIQARMLRIIGWTREQAPNADIIVVGHSLGSVLVTHSLLGDSWAPPSRLLLVTLGSPLPTMSKVFSRYVFGPGELLKRYLSAGSVPFWLHLWRDSDWIGRSLHIPPSEGFAEVSVGDGLHPNYWADSRVWNKVIALMQAQASGTVAELAREWSAAPLTDSETQEAQRLDGGLKAIRWMAWLSLAALGYIGRDVFGPALAAGISRRLLFVLRGLYAANLVFVIPFGLIGFVVNARGTLREVLGRLRCAFSLYSICLKLWLLSGLAFLILRWLARST